MLIEARQGNSIPARLGLHSLRAQPPDYIALTALLVLTASIGRPFSKLSIPGSSIYVTEVMLLTVACLAVWRVGASGAIERVRRVPIVPLALFWAVGAVAALRGVIDWEVWRTLHDIALVEYSVLVVVVAVVCDSKAKLRGSVWALALGGLVALVLFGLSLAVPNSASTIAPGPSFAVGVYIAFFVAAVAARAAHGLPVGRAQCAGAAAGALAMFLTGQRSVWLALFAGVVLLVVLAPAARRRQIAIASAAVFAAAAVIGVTAVRLAPERAPRIESIRPSDRASDRSGDPTRSGQNVEWRLAYWRHAVDLFADAPVAGIGLGAPTAFTWRGNLYDHRTGLTGGRHWADVTGPHNSFVALLMRVGVIGFVPFLVLVGLALRGLARSLRADRAAEDRSVAVTVALGLGATAVIASFHMALEGPFVGIFFWTFLAMALLLGRRDFAEDEVRA